MTQHYHPRTIMSPKAEVQAATVEKFIEGWRGWTPEGFLATWSEDCQQKTLPFSFGVPIRTRAHCEQIFPVLMSVLSNFEVSKLSSLMQHF
jgi:hypothetical protein